MIQYGGRAVHWLTYREWTLCLLKFSLLDWLHICTWDIVVEMLYCLTTSIHPAISSTVCSQWHYTIYVLDFSSPPFTCSSGPRTISQTHWDADMISMAQQWRHRHGEQYNVGGRDTPDSREHLIGQKIWWAAEVQNEVIEIVDPYWW